VWALVETDLWFPSSGGRCSSVHGCGSVHAVVELREDARDLHHLTGHYLRIGDTIALDQGRLEGNKLLLYTAKTGTPVYVPLPPVVMAALSKLQANEAARFFSTGDAKPQTARANWSRYLDALFKLANIKDGHSHRFRDTFAVELLLAGTPLEMVSVLLGHSSVKVTEKHYKPWVRSLQRKLEEVVSRTWASAGAP
jgi:integrase/recombinase XerD